MGTCWENEVKCNVINTSICLADQKAALLSLGIPAILRDEERNGEGRRLVLVYRWTQTPVDTVELIQNSVSCFTVYCLLIRASTHHTNNKELVAMKADCVVTSFPVCLGKIIRIIVFECTARVQPEYGCCVCIIPNKHLNKLISVACILPSKFEILTASKQIRNKQVFWMRVKLITFFIPDGSCC